MKVEIYDDSEERGEVLFLKLRHESDCVYLDAVEVDGTVRRSIAWVTADDRVVVNAKSFLGELGLEFIGQVDR